MTTADFLIASRKAHQAYRSAAARIDANGTAVAGNDAMCRDAVAVALAYRRQAHLADPDHHDAEWANDPAPHDQLMTFYGGYLSA